MSGFILEIELMIESFYEIYVKRLT